MYDENGWEQAIENLLAARAEAKNVLQDPSVRYRTYPVRYYDLEGYGMRWRLVAPYWFAYVVEDENATIMGAFHAEADIPTLVARVLLAR